MNFRYKVGDKGFVQTRKNGWIPVTIESLVEHEGVPCYELDKLLTMNKDETIKYGSSYAYIEEEESYCMACYPECEVLPCPESEIYQLGDKCEGIWLEKLFEDKTAILEESMINFNF